MYVPVAQLDRASASGAEGRAFESPQARFFHFSSETLFLFIPIMQYINVNINRNVCQGFCM